MNRWIEHVKKYQRKHKCTYGVAMKKAKKTYKPSSKTRVKRVNKKTKGRGIFKRIGRRIINTGKKWFKKGGKIVMKAVDHGQAYIRNQLNKNPLSRNGFPGERHAVELQGRYKLSSYNYMGPGTKLNARLARNDPGINAADTAAKKHDIEYNEISKLLFRGINHNIIKKLVRQADDRFLAAIKPYTALREVLIAYLAIKNKNHLEDLGKLSFNKFITNIE